MSSSVDGGEQWMFIWILAGLLALSEVTVSLVNWWNMGYIYIWTVRWSEECFAQRVEDQFRGLLLEECLKGQCWILYGSVSLLISQMMGWSAHLKNGRCKTERSLSHQELCRLNQSYLDWLNRCVTEVHEVNRGKCQALHLGRNNPVYKYSLGVTAVKQTCRRRSWGHGRQQTESHQYTPEARKISCLLHVIRKSTACRSREDSSSLFTSVEGPFGVLGPILS